MRYDIKRLFNEVIIHERDLEKALRKDDLFTANSKRHAIALCKKYIGGEVITRWKEGKNLNNEIEKVILIK